LQIEVGAQTDQGRVRTNNEDAYRIDERLGLFVLSDGMGGAAHGEVASALAVQTVLDYCVEADKNHAALFVEPRPDLSEDTNRLTSAVVMANRKIFDSAKANEEQHGMGATIVAARLSGPRLSLVHVGDSRAYLLRGGALDQLTADHSLVAESVRRGTMTPQEAETSTLQSVLVRSLGAEPHVEPDSDEQILLENDTLVLCSDGLTRMVTDPEIASTLMTIEPAQEAAERLVHLANEYGGEDNVTVIVLRVRSGGGLLSRFRRWSSDRGKNNNETSPRLGGG